MNKQTPRGGKREGAGRPTEGKSNFTVSLSAQNVAKAKAAEKNFSALLDKLLSDWLKAPTLTDRHAH